MLGKRWGIYISCLADHWLEVGIPRILRPLISKKAPGPPPPPSGLEANIEMFPRVQVAISCLCYGPSYLNLSKLNPSLSKPPDSISKLCRFFVTIPPKCLVLFFFQLQPFALRKSVYFYAIPVRRTNG